MYPYNLKKDSFTYYQSAFHYVFNLEASVSC